MLNYLFPDTSDPNPRGIQDLGTRPSYGINIITKTNLHVLIVDSIGLAFEKPTQKNHQNK